MLPWPSYVAEVLEQSYQRLGEIFRFTPTEKMRVEIFPTTATFYPASSLSTRDIEVSGGDWYLQVQQDYAVIATQPGAWLSLDRCLSVTNTSTISWSS
jgi:hypothetical protein